VTNSLVVDASAAITLIRREPDAAAVEPIFRAAVEAGTELHVPDLFWLEVSNILLRRYRVDAATAIAAIRDLDDLGLVSAEIDRALLLLAVARAADTGLTVYDGVYLALAESMDAPLVTLDDQLAHAAGEGALPVRPRRGGIAEQPEVDATRSASPHLSAIGTYLARLRADARLTGT
jgi:predicted nucleic acid-binding protein